MSGRSRHVTPARGGRRAGREGPVGASPCGRGDCTQCGASASLPPTDPRYRKARGQGSVDCLLRCRTGRGPSGRGPGTKGACPVAQRCWARNDAKGASHAGVAGAHFPGGDIWASWRFCLGPLRESQARTGRQVELRGTGVTGVARSRRSSKSPSSSSATRPSCSLAVPTTVSLHLPSATADGP